MKTKRNSESGADNLKIDKTINVQKEVANIDDKADSGVNVTQDLFSALNVQDGLGSGTVGTINKDISVTPRTAGTATKDTISQIDFKWNAIDFAGVMALNASEVKASLYAYGERMAANTYDTPLIIIGGSWNGVVYAPTATYGTGSAGNTVTPTAFTLNSTPGVGNAILIRPALGAIEAAMYNSVSFTVPSGGASFTMTTYDPTVIYPGNVTAIRNFQVNSGDITLSGMTIGSNTNPTVLSMPSASYSITSSYTGTGLAPVITLNSSQITNSALTLNLLYSTATQFLLGSATNPSAGSLYYGTANNTGLSALAAPGAANGTLVMTTGGTPSWATTTTSGQVLVSGASVPAFGAVSLSSGSAGITGTLSAVNGGTGLSTITAHGVMIGEGTGNVATATNVVNTGYILASVASADPAFTNSIASTITFTSGIISNNFSTAASSGTSNGVQVSAAPIAPNDVVNKSYADMIAQGLDSKQSCRAATYGQTSNVPTDLNSILAASNYYRQGAGLPTASNVLYNPGSLTTGQYGVYDAQFPFTNPGTAFVPQGILVTTNTQSAAPVAGSAPTSALTFDGVALKFGDRVLIKDFSVATSMTSTQSTNFGSGSFFAEMNGIYSVGALWNGTNYTVIFLRTVDANSAGAVPYAIAEGVYVFIEEGTQNVATGWVEIGVVTGLNGTSSGSNVVFTQFASIGSYSFQTTSINRFGVQVSGNLDLSSANNSIYIGGGVAGAISAVGGTAIPSGTSSNLGAKLIVTTTAPGTNTVAPGALTLAGLSTGFTASGGNTATTLTMNNSLTVSGTGLVTLSGTANAMTINNTGASGATTLTLTNSGAITLAGSGGTATISNAITVSGTGLITLNGNGQALTLNNTGAAGSVSISFKSSGTLDLAASTISIGTVGANTLTLSSSSAAAVNLNIFNTSQQYQYALTIGNASNAYPTVTDYSVVIARSSFSPVSLVAPGATTGQPLVTNGASTIPVFGNLNVGSYVTGTLPINNGGTNNTTFTSSLGVYFDGTKLASMAGGTRYLYWSSTSGQLFLGPTSATPDSNTVFELQNNSGASSSYTGVTHGIRISSETTTTGVNSLASSPALGFYGAIYNGDSGQSGGAQNNWMRWRVDARGSTASTGSAVAGQISSELVISGEQSLNTIANDNASSLMNAKFAFSSTLQNNSVTSSVFLNYVNTFRIYYGSNFSGIQASPSLAGNNIFILPTTTTTSGVTNQVLSVTSVTAPAGGVYGGATIYTLGLQSVPTGSAYQTFDYETTGGSNTGSAHPQTQRSVLAFVHGALGGASAPITFADNSGSSALRTEVTFLDASATNIGFINISAQAFAGLKTFNAGLTIASSQPLTLAGFTTNNILYIGASGLVTQNSNFQFNGTSLVTLIATSIGTTPTANLLLQNTTSATALISQSSPGLVLAGTGWYAGSSSIEIDWMLQTAGVVADYASELVIFNKAVGVSSYGRKISFGSDRTIRMWDPSSTYYTAFVSGSSPSANTTYALPNAYPSISNAVLLSNTTGTLTWASTALLTQAYQTFDFETTGGSNTSSAHALTQRSVLAFVHTALGSANAPMTFADNSGSSALRTEITFLDATASVGGFVSNQAQVFGGTKTFNNGLTIASGQNLTLTGATSNGVIYASSSAIASTSSNFLYNSGTNLATLLYVSVGTAANPILMLQNNSAATSGATQYSPGLVLEGTGWTGAASTNVDWMLQTQPLAGATTSEVALLNRITFGTYTKMVSFGSDRSLRIWNSATTFYAGFTVNTLTANNIYTLPSAFPGVSGAVLTSDTSGVLTWGTGAGISGTGASYRLAVWTGSGSMGNSAAYQDAATPTAWSVSANGTSNPFLAITNMTGVTSTVSTGQITLLSTSTPSGQTNDYRTATLVINPSTNQKVASVAAFAIQAGSGNVPVMSVDGLGNLRANSKSFVIPHPTKADKLLIYGVLEGPEHGVYHRGMAQGRGRVRVELPEYWSKLAHSGYSIQITPRGNYGCYIVRQDANAFEIARSGFCGKFRSFEFEFYVVGSRRDASLIIEEDASDYAVKS